MHGRCCRRSATLILPVRAEPTACASLAPPRQAYDNAKSIKNKSQAAVLAAIVFLACRHTGNARTFKEICAVVPQASVKVSETWLFDGGVPGGQAGVEHGQPMCMLLSCVPGNAAGLLVNGRLPATRRPQEIGRIYKSVVRELKLQEELGNKQVGVVLCAMPTCWHAEGEG